jgi:hypothetical protein
MRSRLARCKLKRAARHEDSWKRRINASSRWVARLGGLRLGRGSASSRKGSPPIKTKINRVKTKLIILVTALACLSTLNPQLSAVPLGTAFSYQGRLNEGGDPAQGIFDLRFSIYDVASGGTPVTMTVTNTAVTVSNGLFTAVVDVGNVFDGNARWLEIAVRPNGAATDFTTLAPRQPLSPSPYALYAAAAGSAQGVAAGSVTGAGIADGTITGDKLSPGQLVKTLNGLTDDVTLTAGSNATVVTAGSTVTISAVPATVVTNTGWGISGNSGTTPGANFLGTSDNQPLELKVNGQRVLRLEPNANGPIVIGGSSNNWAFADGATIAGGVGNSIQSNATYSTIAGGYYNLIQSSNIVFAPKYDFIGGGIYNTIEPYTWAGSIPGGYANRIQYFGSYATIAGGLWNVIGSNAYSAAIGGGRSNVIGSYAQYATIAGGTSNTVGGSFATIGGGYYNIIEPAGFGGAILSGVSNRIQYLEHYPVIAGGLNNLIGTNADSSAIGGGQYNTISNQAQYATIPGGSSNTVGASYSLAAGQRAKANHPGTFVWADSQGSDFISTWTNQFLIRAAGGVGINKNYPAMGALDVNGTVFANNFSGPGGSLYNLNASSISSGTLSDARLSGNVALLNRDQTFSGSNTFNGTVVATNAANQFGGTFSGNGAGLTNLNVSGGGPLSTNVALLDTNQLFTGSNTFGGVINATNSANVFVGTFSGSGGALSGLNASQLSGGTVPLARLPDSVLTNNSGNVTLGGTFSGNGSGLTNLNAAQLTSGVIPLSQLPAAVLTNNASGVTVSGTFQGNGAGMTNVNLTGLNSGGVFTWPGNFSLASSPSVGSGPRSVVAADVNGDGKLDLISGNYNANTLSVLTNDGSGGFAVAASISVGSHPTSVAAADINGDGRVDLIATINNANSLTVLTNNGSGGFAASSSLGVGARPSQVVAADMNGDGKMDLVCANHDSNNLTVLTNSGSGGFVVATSPSVGTGPYSVAVADVNGDGKLDLISANYTSGNLTVLTNNGNGGFGLYATPAVVGNARFVVAADLNGDGKVDLVAANDLSMMYVLTVLTNNGSSGFGVSAQLPTGAAPYCIAAADVNGDGKVDLICANLGDSTLTLFTNDGSGGFTPAALLAVGNSPYFVVAGDVNGDGKVDLVSANSSANTLSVLFNSPSMSGTFAGTFSGSGSGLTGLNAAALSTGTVADARLSTNVALLNASQSFSGTNTFAGPIIATNTLSQFAGSGSGLSNLNAAALASGTLPSGRLSGTYSQVLNFDNAANSFSGSGASLSALSANNLTSGTLPSGRLSGTYSGALTLNNSGNAFSGSGANLTGLNAANLSAGLLPDARLSTNVAMRNADQAFSSALTLNGGAYLNDHDLWLREDAFHGLGWYGAGKLYAGLNVNGPALYGGSGGVLGVHGAGTDVPLLGWNSTTVFTDPLGQNAGTLSPGLTFGPGSGEGISSKRTSGTGQFGLDFYTGGTKRMTIDNYGNVGIGTASPQSLLQVNGTATVNVLEILGGSDVAEPFAMSAPDVPKGAVVVIDDEHPGALKLSDRAYDQRVAGVVSGANGINPGLTLQQQGVTQGGQNVALTGRVYALAEAGADPIKPGDLLTTSAVPGHCMKASDPVKAQGAILGKAMTGLKEARGMVLVLVTLQ